MRGRLRQELAAAGYLAGWRVIRALPERTVNALFGWGADRAARRGGSGVAQLRRNLRRVVGGEMADTDLDTLVRAGMRSYARYWHEAFRLPAMTRPAIVARMRMENPELLAALHARGKGVVVALSHSGNWDHTGAWAAAEGYDVAAVAQRVQPERLYERFVAFRESLGIRVVPLTGGRRPLSAELTTHLRTGGVLCLLADRDISETGGEVTFFGESVRMPIGPALLALRTGAPLIVCQLWFTDEGTAGRLVGPFEAVGGTVRQRVGHLTQQMADAFADGIAAHPADWHMLQPCWLADLDTSNRVDRPATI